MTEAAGTPAPRVQAEVEGQERNLHAVARQFAGREPRVERVADRWVLVGPTLDAAYDNGAGSIHEAAVELMRNLDGAMRVVDPQHRPLRVTGRYHGPSGWVTEIVLEAAIELEATAAVHATLSGGTPVAPPPPPGPDLLDTAADHADLGEVLDLMGGPDRLSTFDLWKVLEIVRESVGGPEPRSATPALLNKGWLTKDEWDSLGAVLHDPARSGKDARHARHRPSSANPMSLGEAREVVSRVVRDWAASL